MADPEIELPRMCTEDVLDGSYSQLTYDSKEKGHSPDMSDPRSSETTAEDEIHWHYLTFETSLPQPSGLVALDQTKSLPPDPPDLKKFENPFNWTPARKSIITWISCVATAVTAFAAGSYTSGSSQMSNYWGVSHVAITVGVTTFTTGFAIAPMVLAPFSEFNGRRPIFVVTGTLFVLLQLCCAVTRSYAGMLVARFFVGCSSSTFSTMVGGVVADIYRSEDRNTAMALFSGAALFGTGLGPLVSGFVAANTTWRWIFYLQVITCGVVQIIVVFFFKETRGSVLLSRKAKTLNKYYEALEMEGYIGLDIPSSSDPSKTISQRIRWKVKSDEERSSLGRMIGISIYRPFYLLLTEPVVFFFSLWIAFAWAVLYLTFGAIPLVFQTSHNFTLDQAGAVFSAISIAAILSTIVAIVADDFTKKRFPQTTKSPEGRLYIACIQSALLPIGLFWFGWTSFPSVPWIVPALAVGCATMGIFSIYLAVFNYLADTYGTYASSALAAQVSETLILQLPVSS